MRPFEELVTEAVAADVTGWGFGWLNGRATEERTPWGYAKLLADRLGQVESALDVDTGGGEVLAEAPNLPPRMVVTEAWPPNARRARELLEPRGVQVIDTVEDAPLPLPDESFDLVTARHPVRPNWGEIHRVLVPGGCYFAQHVGPASAFDLIERFLGPLPEEPKGRNRSGNRPRHATPAWSSPSCVTLGVGWSSMTWEPLCGSYVSASGGYHISPSRSTTTSSPNSTGGCGAANPSSRIQADT